MSRKLWIISFVFCLFFSPNAKSALLEFHHFKTHSRLTAYIDPSTDVELKDKKNGFELLIKGASRSDLSAAELEKFKNDNGRLSTLDLKENSQGVKITGTWKFPDGKEELAFAKMEHFEYRDKNPSRYVLDFWIKKGPTLLQSKAVANKKRKLDLQNKYTNLAKTRAIARASHQKVQEELEEIVNYCSQNLDEKNEVFLPFYPIHEPVQFKKWFGINRPDQDYVYSDIQGETQEIKYVRLSLSLYKKGNPALTIKVIEFLEKEFPLSPYFGEILFLKANALLKLNLKVQAREVMQQILIEKKDARATLQTAIFMAAESYERGAYLLALENFLWLIENNPEHPLGWVFHLAAAESLYQLKQTDRAAKEYQWVLLNAKDKKVGAEAALRLGDLYLLRLEHDRALASYYQGIKNFAEEAQSFPSVHINRAESLYWLKQFDRAEEAFKKFLEDYSGHPAGWRATYRLGEIYARKNESRSRAESRKWFYETINRYPLSPGATLARMQLIPCVDHGGLDFEGVKTFFESDVKKFTGQSETDLKNFQDFKALAKVRAFVAFRHYSESVDAAIDEMEALKATSPVKPKIEKILQSVFRKTILSYLEEGGKFKALSFYQTKILTHPKIKEVIQGAHSDYLMKLSQAASDLGLGMVASELVKIPVPVKTESLDDTLIISEKKFSEAKALWVEQGFTAENKIREILSQIVSESSYSQESEILLSILDEQKGLYQSSLEHAVRSQLLSSNKDTLNYWMARLHFKLGDLKSALFLMKKSSSENSSNLDYLKTNLSPSEDEKAFFETELLCGLKNWPECVDHYSKLIARGHGENRVLYEYSKALIQNGNRTLASKKLEELANSKDEDVWKKLAKEGKI